MTVIGECSKYIMFGLASVYHTVSYKMQLHIFELNDDMKRLFSPHFYTLPYLHCIYCVLNVGLQLNKKFVFFIFVNKLINCKELSSVGYHIYISEVFNIFLQN